MRLISLDHATNHGGKKLGVWEAPSQEILVFGGKFLEFGGKFGLFVHIKHITNCGKIGQLPRK